MARRLRITGHKEIDKKLRKLPEKVTKKILRRAMTKALKPVRDTARGYCPVDTGKLRDSIKIRAGNRSRLAIKRQVTTSGSDNMFSGETYYGGMVEYGTQNMQAKPFMRPAYDAEKDNAKKLAIDEIRKILNEETR